MIGYNIYNIDGGQIEMKALKIIKTKARDNSRVPMHWMIVNMLALVM